MRQSEGCSAVGRGEHSVGAGQLSPGDCRNRGRPLQAVLAHEGRPRTHYLLDQLIGQDRAGHGGYAAPNATPYVNTIRPAIQKVATAMA